MNTQNRIPAVPGKSSFALELWFSRLNAKGLLFNPDDRPEDIVSIATGEPAFTTAECALLNESLQILFEHHGDKVREVALRHFHKAMDIQPDYLNA